MSTASIRPRLVVRDGAAAIDFYTSAIGAEELHRFADPSGRIVDAELRVGDDVFSLTEEQDDVNLSPTTLGGSPLLLTLTVDDADAVGAAMERAGAEVVFPIDDQFYGRREGRLRDPFGHLWIVGQVIESLTDEEIDARLTGRT
jgi:PhnB protein